MKDEFRILIDEIKENTINGDIELGKMIIYFLLDHFSSLIEDDVREIGNKLSESKTEMATIQNISRVLMSFEDSPKLLHQQLLAFKEQTGQRYINGLIERFRRDIQSPVKIMTISRSSTVKNAIIDLSRNNLLKNLFVIHSYPGLEGVELCKELNDIGVKNTGIYLAEIPHYISDVDMVLSGADAISNDYIINKVGTHLLFEYASFYKRKTVVLGNPLKRIVTDIKINNRIFEKIPAKLVSHIYE